jgi:hypothetical protein
LLGLWKTEANLTHLDDAITEAKTALAAGYPAGCDLVARFCIARSELRDPKAASRDILDKFVKENTNSGPALAAAAMLAIDVADRRFYENCRQAILKDHTESPMMWLFTSFLLDRHHEYWLFQVPFTAGWSFGRRESYFMTQGRSEPAQRMLKTELQTLDGKPLRIPEDLDSPWTIIVFAKPGPWSRNREDGLPSSPVNMTNQLAAFTATRAPGEVKVFVAMLSGDAESIRAGYEGKEPLCPLLTVPNGINNPLIHRLGIQSEDNQLNSVLIDKNGRIVLMASGLATAGRGNATSHINVIAGEEEISVVALLEKGDVEAAKEKIFRFAPPFDPAAVDAKGRPLKKPTENIAHLRARARVYMALKEWDKALADAEEAVKLQLSTDGGMSLRTKELDASEALRDQIKALKSPASESK